MGGPMLTNRGANTAAVTATGHRHWSPPTLQTSRAPAALGPVAAMQWRWRDVMERADVAVPKAPYSR